MSTRYIDLPHVSVHQLVFSNVRQPFFFFLSTAACSSFTSLAKLFSLPFKVGALSSCISFCSTHGILLCSVTFLDCLSSTCSMLLLFHFLIGLRTFPSCKMIFSYALGSTFSTEATLHTNNHNYAL